MEARAMPASHLPRGTQLQPHPVDSGRYILGASGERCPAPVPVPYPSSELRITPCAQLPYGF